MMAKIQHNSFKTVYLPLDEFREENKIEENITIKETGEENEKEKHQKLTLSEIRQPSRCQKVLPSLDILK